jgi:tetratricopeptide (TPR) repeat protein
VAKPKAYEGDESFYFVSYAHDDDELVMAELAWMAEAGLKVWYDDGIHVGSSWRQTLATALLKAEGVIFFCTETSSRSQNCLQEINFALDEEKPIFVVQLDDAALPPELRLALGTRQQLRRSGLDDHVYRNKLLEGLGKPQPTAANTQTPAQVDTAGATPTDAPVITRLPVVALTEPRNLSQDASFDVWLESFSEGLIGRLSQRFLRCTERENGADYRLSISGHADGDDRQIRVRLTSAEGEIIGGWQRPTDLHSQMDRLTITASSEIAGLIIQNEQKRVLLLPIDSMNAFEMVVSAMRFQSGKQAERQAIIEELNRAQALDPRFPLPPGIMAFIYGYIVVTSLSRDEKADIESALENARKAQAMAVNQPLVLGWCSYAYRSVGEVDMALEIAERATELAGSAAGMWGGMFGPGSYGSGLYPALIEKNRPDEVLARMDNDPIPSYRYRAFAHALKGDFDEAVVCARRFVGFANQNFQPWMELANLQGHAGDIEGGLQSIATAQRLLPSLDPAYWRKGVEHGWGSDETVIEALGGGIEKILATAGSDLKPA